MDTKSAKEIQFLLKILSELLLDENHSLRDSLQRISSLLKHAVELLNDSLFSVNSTIQNQQTLLNDEAKVQGTDMPSSPGENLLQSLRKALGITIQLNHILSKTTRSLQVEDIVSQIVAQVIDRSFAIDEALKELKNISTEDNLVINQDLLKHTITHIETLRNRSVSNIVKQSSLNEGDIELF